jgi:hypothetical protein
MSIGDCPIPAASGPQARLFLAITGPILRHESVIFACHRTPEPKSALFSTRRYRNALDATTDER